MTGTDHAQRGNATRSAGARPSRVGLYPGSFDPPTFGHLDVVRRGRRLFDRLVIGVGRNPDKQTLFTAEERVGMLRALCGEIAGEEPESAVVDVVTYDGLTVDCARRVGASVLLRGVRNLSDMQYEVQQAVTNREVAGVETAFVVAGQSLAYVSSTLIRQITALAEGDTVAMLAPLCPPLVIDELDRKKRERPDVLRRIAGAGTA